MENKNKVSKDPPITIRQKLIEDLIRTDTSIMSTDELMDKMKKALNSRYPGKYPNAKFKQPLISKDMRKLGIKPRGRNKGFEFTDKAQEKQNTDGLETLFRLASINANDIVHKVHPLILKVEGYGQAISSILKKMYPQEIVEAIHFESSLVIYFATPDDRDKIYNVLSSLAHNVS